MNERRREELWAALYVAAALVGIYLGYRGIQLLAEMLANLLGL